MRTPKTKDDYVDQFEQLLWFHFPDEKGAGPVTWWGEEFYKRQFFAIAILTVGVVSRDTLSAHVRTHWLNRRQVPLSPDDECQIEKLLDAWREWQWVLRTLEEER